MKMGAITRKSIMRWARERAAHQRDVLGVIDAAMRLLKGERRKAAKELRIAEREGKSPRTHPLVRGGFIGRRKLRVNEKA
jgi:hypothetical protein